LFELGGADAGAVEFAVGCHECAPVTAGMQGQRAVEPEGDEKGGAVGLEMGEVAAVFHAIIVVAGGECLRVYAY